MNWSYLGVVALLPFVWALAATLLGGALWALRLHLGGGSSRVALGRFLRALGVLFPTVFLLASLWSSRHTLKGLAGIIAQRPVDQRAMGLLRLQGEGFLKADPEAAVGWFRKAAQQGDGPAQFYLARALASGRGTVKQPEEAGRWAEAAARQGLPEAMILSGNLCAARDPALATTWFLRAMDGLQPGLRARDPRSCLLFGQMRCNGKGLPPDPVEGLAWMRVAEYRGLPGIETLPIRLLETQLPPAQQAAAELRAKALLSPP